MNEEINSLELCGLVTDAKRGDRPSLTRLAKVVEDDLRSYIYRITLNNELTQDILQETLLTMVTSVKEIKRVDSFWPWLLKIALNKVQDHYREKKKRKKFEFWAIAKERLQNGPKNESNVYDRMARQELSEAIFNAMNQLKFDHRNILVLRCFEQVSFAQIGELTGCSELTARVMFYRAKLSLKQKLARRGFGRKNFLMALGLFGLLTTPKTVTATALTAASMEVGPGASLLGFLTTKVGILSATALGAFTLTIAIKAFLWFIVAFLILILIAICSVFAK